MKLFLAPEVQGSTARFIRFLDAAASSGADAAVLCGDLTGSAVVPIVQRNNGRFDCTLADGHVDIATREEMARVKASVEMAGDYWVVQTEDELRQTAGDPATLEMLFKSVTFERLNDWMQIADDHLREHPQRVLIAAGTGDWPFVDGVIARSDLLEPCDGSVVTVDGHELVTSSLGPPTRWSAPREVPEVELGSRLRTLCAQVQHPENAVVCLANDCKAAAKALRDFKPLLRVHRLTPGPLGASHRSGHTLSLDPGPQLTESTDGSLRAIVAVLGDRTVEEWSFVTA
jgi:Icc-related predicted phosphoesterase